MSCKIAFLSWYFSNPCFYIGDKQIKNSPRLVNKGVNEN